MKTFHILNGDCLAEQLKQSNISGNFIVFRECLIDGECSALGLSDFWKKRSRFITQNYQVSEQFYAENTIAEIEKIQQISAGSEVCLWFENDLFCQVNMWFLLSLLSEMKDVSVFRIFPNINDKADYWKGFSVAKTFDLEQAFAQKVLFSENDILIGKNLWQAYQNNDFEKLKALSKTDSLCFEKLEEVCQAHIERFPRNQKWGRVEQTLLAIIENRNLKFDEVFSEFIEREGIYGFGDLQIKRIYNELIVFLSNKKVN